MQNDLKKYIQLETEKGFDEYTIKKALMNNNYTEEEIADAFREMGQKKKITIIATIALVILIVSFSIFYYYNYFPKVKIGQPTESNQISYSQEQAKLAEQAIKEGNLASCKNTGKLVDYCTGIITEDTGACEKVNGRLGEHCIMKIAEKKNDVSLCKYLNDLKPECYLHFAFANKDKNLCSLSGSYKDYCTKKLG